MTDRTIARRMALEFRIWQHCAPIGWDITMSETAAALVVTTSAVRWAAKRKGWTDRFRVTASDEHSNNPPAGPSFGGHRRMTIADMQVEVTA